MADSALERAIEAVGSAAELARKVGVTAMAVSNWKVRGIPAERVLMIEKASGVKRYELRPDIYPEPRKRKAAAA